MCGITGAVWTQQELAISGELLAAMTDVLAHRGPDDRGVFSSELRQQSAQPDMPGCGLGFRRLSIIDLAAGNQPMSNEDGTIWTVFNGEIYNYQDLRKRLQASGHQLRTESDSEVIAHLYEDEGPALFEHLNGMFAVAIWDSNRRQLILGRDRLGQKPLVYAHQPGRLMFASELKSLLQVPNLAREIDLNAVDDFMTYQYIPYSYTIFKSVSKLPPGHRAIWSRDKLVVEPYWNPNWQIESEISLIDAKTRLRELLKSAVEFRLQSDVPLGSFLSGGIDSSLLVALMKQLTDQPVKTFSIGFHQKEYDESAYAKQVAEHLGTEHQEFKVMPDAIQILPKLIWHYDEPFADSSAIPTWYVSEMTKQHVTVALSGDGGDELFAGYQRYQAIRLGQWIDRLGPMKNVLGARAWQRLPASPRQKGVIRRWKRFTDAVAKPPTARYLDWIAIFNEQRRSELYRAEYVSALDDSDPIEFLESGWKRALGRDAVTQASVADLHTYLPCDLMTKTDIASMAHGLEVRQPFLDYRLVEFAMQLPVSMKLRGSHGKLLLKETFGDLLPEAVWNRRKMGFGVPLDHWFREELNELAWETLGSEQARIHDWFHHKQVVSLLEEHSSRTFDHAYRLWSLLVLELWLQEWA